MSKIKTQVNHIWFKNGLWGLVRVKNKNAMKGFKMMMRIITFNDLQSKQFILDERIKQEKNIDYVSIKDKLIALDVELSEFANEVRFFKFWSNKGMDREKALTEYVDALHFFLSLANDMEIDNVIYHDNGNKNMNDLFLECKQYVNSMYTDYHPENVWKVAFSLFMDIGERAGFSEDDIYQEYLNKNQINHDRQASGY